MIRAIKYIAIVATVCVLWCCDRPDDDVYPYEQYSSEVSPDDEEVTFYKNNSSIPAELFPTLNFEKGTFSSEGVIELSYLQMTSANLPSELSSFSDVNYQWGFETDVAIDKEIQLKIPMPTFSPEHQIDDYIYLIKPYRIYKNSDPKILSNWEQQASNYSYDSVANCFIIHTQNLDSNYAVLFQEIQREDNFVITISGDTSYILSGFVNNFYSPSSPTTKGMHINNDSTHFHFFGYWGEVFEFGFDCLGNEVGTITGDSSKTYFTYDYVAATSSWRKEYEEITSQVTFDEIGDIGESVVGSIEASFTTNNSDTIYFDANFDFIRTR